MPNSLQYPPIMCLTRDGLDLDHLAQTRALCASGAKWIQLRMKTVPAAERLAIARAVADECRAHHVLCIVNDSVELAIQSGANGVHLGPLDGDWAEARRRLGPNRVLGGTVNNADAARSAAASGVLDYVGIGPLHFTTTKQNLAPVLGLDGIAKLLPLLGGLPAWVIGGACPDDMPGIRKIGAAGAAICSPLYVNGDIAANYQSFTRAWESAVPSQIVNLKS